MGDLLIDCGPMTCLDVLLSALGDWRPRAILLTHIHFDHAGSAGELVRRWPDLEIYVHRSGAKHLAQPERLEASARRVFGESFDDRFGPLTPLPEANLHPLDGGESVHGLRVLYTPGHAGHHVAYVDEATGQGFVGDLGAVRLVAGGPLLPATPPPDIDVGAWLDSISAVKQYKLERLGLPHFGEVIDPLSYLEGTADALQRHVEVASRLGGGEYAGKFEIDLRAAGELTGDYETVVPLEGNYRGLRRALEKTWKPGNAGDG
jgi:glyoxylase-like metal-dependent hydrolase (beta-lactamase superfamily II)